MLRETLLGMVTAAPVAAEAPAPAPAEVEAPAPADSCRLLRPVQGRMSSEYGMRVHPVTGQYKMHTGVDFAAPTGTPIAAAAGGTVSFAGVRGGYGNLVIIDHPGGTQTYYAHASTMAVRAGDRVRAGEVVATVGATGLATGPICTSSSAQRLARGPHQPAGAVDGPRRESPAAGAGASPGRPGRAAPAGPLHAGAAG